MSIKEYAIKGEAFYLSKIFSSDFQYSIPDYQRPYSWEEEHIKQLFDDLYEFYKRDSEESYFLGSIVVIKNEHKPQAEVVDGQQRLTSLTILFASLASFLNGEYKKNVEKYLQQPEDLAESISAQPRLILRNRDKDFFRKYIQELRIEELNSLNIEHDCKTDAQRKIYNNTRVLLSSISDTFGNENKIFEFVKFLVQRCCLVVVSTPNQKSAFRIFSVMNNRGLDLLPTDILKADIIGKIQTNQHEYTQKWEDLEEELGRDYFNDLFGHIRMIKLNKKAQNSILEEFQESVLSKITSFTDFIDSELSSYVSIFKSLKDNKYQIDKYKKEVNQYINWLNKVGFSEWIPVALLFLHQKPDAETVQKFFKHLEILTSYLHLSAKNINQRIERYSLVLQDLKNNPKQISSHLLLKPEDKKEFKKLLDENIYIDMIAIRRNYLILRLDEMISDGAASYSGKSNLLTIEHILPQKIEGIIQWEKWWKSDNDAQGQNQHELWLHRLANLVPLNKRRNSAASNWDFDTKKDKYFLGKEGVSSYALTSQVLREKEWTPEVVEARQSQLLKILYKHWELDE